VWDERNTPFVIPVKAGIQFFGQPSTADQDGFQLSLE
jgi:hypothetical protein